MKLILTIALHSDAAARTDRLCAANVGALRRAGIHCPATERDDLGRDVLADAVMGGRRTEASEYMDRVRRAAAKAGCSTVVLGSEALYAVSTLLSLSRSEEPNAEDVWARETSAIQALRDACGELAPAVVAYLCPQDEFAVSRYEELVMAPSGIDLTCDDFVASALPAFDYDRQFALWEAAFGVDRVKLRNVACDRVVDDFRETVLEGRCGGLVPGDGICRRPARDVVEVKRIFNRSNPDDDLASVAARAYRAIANDLPDATGHHVYAPETARCETFAAFEAGNVALAKRHGLAPLPVVGASPAPSYPELTVDRAVEVYLRYRRVMDGRDLRRQLAARRLATLMAKRLPLGKSLARLVGRVAG
ncbi:MAG: hypothetical protein RIM84_05065 [Alphaproteobacteria bacterium]